MDLSIIASGLTNAGMALGVSPERVPATLGAALVVLAALLNVYRARLTSGAK